MENWQFLDTDRIKKAVEESKSAFDDFDPYVCTFNEFKAHMALLDFRSNLFGMDVVLEHAERYRYRINPETLNFVLTRIAANSRVWKV